MNAFAKMLPFRTCATAILVFCLNGALPAQPVTYQAELSLPLGRDFTFAPTHSPAEASGPAHDLSVQRLFLVTKSDIYRATTGADPTFEVFVSNYPAAMKVDETTPVAVANSNGNGRVIYFVGFRNTLYALNVEDPDLSLNIQGIRGTPPGIPAANIATLNGQWLTMLLNNGTTFYRVALDGAATVAFGGPGSGPGQFSSPSFQNYGPDGLLYIMDYGNQRIQVMDPTNNFAFVRQFPFNPEMLTPNMQFAIGPTGNIYLGDGVGGGSTYSAKGTFLGAFPLSVPPSTNDKGNPYLMTDNVGHVFTFDDTGAHQYLDTTATPEADPDGDGTPNWVERLMGLDPNDASSCFTVAAHKISGGCTLTWPFTTGLTFAIWRTPILVGPGVDWQNIATVTDAGTFTDPAPLAQGGYYKVALQF